MNLVSRLMKKRGNKPAQGQNVKLRIKKIAVTELKLGRANVNSSGFGKASN